MSAEVEDLRVGQGAQGALRGVVGLDLFFRVEGCNQVDPFALVQPFGIGRAVVQVGEGPDAHGDRQGAGDDEHQLPALQTAQPVQVQKQAGKRAAEDEGQRRAEVEEAVDPAAELRGDPVGQVQDDAGEEPRLRDAEQDAEEVEGPFVLGEHHQRRDDAPADHDPGQPDLGPELAHQDVAGDLKGSVAEEEDAGAQCVGRVREAGVGLEGRLGEPRFERSRNARMYISSRTGISRRVTRRMIGASASLVGACW